MTLMMTFIRGWCCVLALKGDVMGCHVCMVGSPAGVTPIAALKELGNMTASPCLSVWLMA